MNPQEIIEKLTEKCAEIEHTRWAKWQNYMHSHVYDSSQSINPHLKVIPTELYNRWERQIATPYSELSEKEKESDKDQVQMYLPEVIQTIISLYEQELKEIPEEREIPIPYYSGVHGYQDQYERDVNKANTNLGYNQALQDLRQSIQSKLDSWNKLLVNRK